ncbi:MAG: zinc-binding dehydrogenase [Nitrososphaerota archaeon]|nr:zinc-binding dehydrogenase [Nitrososphaerota archaeon]MDG6922773.1 zinc-binding dehydrogenase [Nitrososphaerota archaeon]
MLAARFEKKEGNPVVVEDVSAPELKSTDVLVEIKAAGVCGTDVHYRKREFVPKRIPITLGHEGAGVVKEVGDDVTNVRVDDNVVIHYIISCGQCPACNLGYDNRCYNRQSLGRDYDGVFAGYVRIPARSVVKISKGLPMEWAAIAACAVSSSYHATTVSGLKRGDTAVVFGAGGVGLHAAMWAKFFGAAKIIAVDLVDSKLETAKSYGVDVIANPSKVDVLDLIAKETDGMGADVALECTGSPKAMEQALKAIKGKVPWSSGSLVSVGFQTKPWQVDFFGLREGRMTVSGDHTLTDLRQVMSLIENGRIDLSKSITHRLALENINEALDLLESNTGHIERVVINDFN